MGALEVQRRLGLSKKRADILMSRPDFPEPTHLGRGRVWDAEDVEAWIRIHRPHLAPEADITSPEHENAPFPDHEGRGTALSDRIQARLELALQHQERVQIERPEARSGLATGGPDAPVIRLTMEDIARIAAEVAAED